MIDDYLTYTKFITGLGIELIPKVIFQHESRITKLNWHTKLILNIANSSKSNINMTTLYNTKPNCVLQKEKGVPHPLLTQDVHTCKNIQDLSLLLYQEVDKHQSAFEPM